MLLFDELETKRVTEAHLMALLIISVNKEPNL